MFWLQNVTASGSEPHVEVHFCRGNCYSATGLLGYSATLYIAESQLKTQENHSKIPMFLLPLKIINVYY